MAGTDTEALTFKQMVRDFDVTPRTLRYYEYVEILRPERTGRERYYDRRQQARLKLTLRGRRFGMRLEDIRLWLEMHDESGSEAQMRAWLDLAAELEARLTQEIEERQQAIAELRETAQVARRTIGDA
ncbi:MerR family transcriptional regulator [Pseudooceanicola aestuarii]|uniref:MerR family transcriptional regulator n=1 Tax=Pseudooceanicola aestuarii TaxID=2697319 RepID=UPI0013D3AAA0|nr:MerR family transcriptional regulator [Pseudooceanicola aestuarii]